HGGADGTDVTENYSITPEAGTLTITKRPVTINVENKEFSYNGEQHSVGYNVVKADQNSGLLKDHKEKVTLVNDKQVFVCDEAVTVSSVTIESDGVDKTGNITNVAENKAENNPVGTVVIRHGGANGVDVTENYTIETKAGTLTINPRPVTITAETNDDFVYNGMEHKVGYQVSDPGTDKGLLSGHTEVVELKDNTRTFVGGNDVLVDTVTIKSGETDVTGNYDITKQKGHINVNAATGIEIVITAASADKVYDGAPLTASHYTVNEENLLPGDDVYAVISGSITEVTPGVTANNQIESYEIRHGGPDGAIVTENYEVSEVPGTLTINPRPVTVTAETNDSFVYDGTEHSVSYTVSKLGENEGLLSGHTEVVELEGNTRTYVGGNQVTVKSVKIMADKADMTKNYDIKKDDGHISVSKATGIDITITAGDAEKVYDGTPLTESGYTVNKENLLPGDEVYAVTSGSITDVTPDAKDNNLISSYVIRHGGKDGVDVTENYNITPVPGTLKVTPRPVTITAGTNNDFIYDGTEHSVSYTIAESDKETGLVKGHTAEVDLIGNKRTFAGENPVEVGTVKLLAGEADVTSNYEVIRVLGHIKVSEATGRVITITAPSANKVYDGTPLTAVQCEATGNLFEGDSIHVNATGSITDVSDNAVNNNPVGKVTIMHGDVDVTANYDITPIAGTLRIDPRPVTFTAETKSFPYDGKEHSVSYFVSEPGEDTGLLSGHKAENVTLIGATQKFVGTYPVQVDTVSISDGKDDKTSNYSITRVDGQIIINKVTDKAITIKAKDAAKVYDGTPLTEPGFELTNGTLFEGDKIYVEATGSITEVSESTVGNNPLGKIVIRHGGADGTDVTENYSITPEAGTLTITK
ncbi:MBG domain-containing protein, partial [Clostridium sp. MCC353]|uniref:MBG domain-containing protein n=1 Tax=Clostridium sp. MCC353 TaxID=2592646 RepID=UPI001C023049